MDIMNNCVGECEVDLRESLRQNLVLAGGTTLLPNFEDQLEKELIGTYFKTKAKKPDRLFSSWQGAALLAQLDRNDESSNVCQFISKEEYEEFGTARLI